MSVLGILFNQCIPTYFVHTHELYIYLYYVFVTFLFFSEWYVLVILAIRYHVSAVMMHFTRKITSHSNLVCNVTFFGRLRNYQSYPISFFVHVLVYRIYINILSRETPPKKNTHKKRRNKAYELKVCGIWEREKKKRKREKSIDSIGHQTFHFYHFYTKYNFEFHKKDFIC